MSRYLTRTVATALLALVATACASSSEEAGPSTEPSEEASASAEPTDPPSTPSPSESPDGDASNEDSANGTGVDPTAWPERTLPRLFDARLSGGRLREVRTVAETGSYRQAEVRYRSGDLTISGQLFVPDGKGPFPAVVINHGYIEPSVYVSGQGVPREQAAFAQAGFVVLHTDYRGHAASDPATDLIRELRLGYARDAVAAAKALKQLDVVDSERVGMVGRSMGGGVTLAAVTAAPGVVDAAVVWASVSSRFRDNWNRWTRTERPDAARRFTERFGTPAESPRFWRGLSSRPFFDRIDVPVLMHHGTEDESCPYRWAVTTRDALANADVDVTLRTYRGEAHTFTRDWQQSMDTTIRFLRRQLR